MDYSVNEVKSWLREIRFHVPAEDIRQKMDEKIKVIRKNLSIPGFRKGKAPAEVVRLRYGKAILEEVLEDIVNDTYQKIADEKDLPAVGVPEVKEQKWDEQDGLDVTIEVQVEPEIHLEKYTGLKLTKEIYKVTDEEIEKTIEKLRKENATVETVEDGAAEGDYVKAELQEVSETGVPLVGRRQEKEIRIGDKAYGEEFDKGLLGAKKDNQLRLSGRFPAQPELVHHYSVKVLDVTRHVLPEVTDDFAKDLGDYESVEDLRKKIREYLEYEGERRAREALIESAINALIDANPFEVPPVMVETYLDAYVEDIQKQINSEFNVNAFREGQRPLAIREIKWHLMKKKLAEVAGIEISDEDIDRYIENLAESTGQNERKLKAKYSLEKHRNRLKNELLEKKIIDFLLEKSEIEEVELKTSQLETAEDLAEE